MTRTKSFHRMNVWEILRENALQIVMYILGTVLVGLVSWWLAGLYLAYSLLSNLLYMAWVCPYCGHYALGTSARPDSISFPADGSNPSPAGPSAVNSAAMCS